MTDSTPNASGRTSRGNSSLDRRRFIQATGAGAVATLLAGCSEGGDGEDGGGDGGTDTPGGTTTPGQGQVSGTLKVGHLAPMDNPLGIGSVRSAGMAIQNVNNNGGVGDGQLELVRGDTQDGPNASRAVVERMVLQDNVDVIIGTFSSEVTQGIIDLVAQHNVPFIVTGSAAPTTITEFIGQDYERYKNTFRSGPINSNLQAEAQLGYAQYLESAHGWNTFAFVADDAEWTKPFMNGLTTMLEDEGFNIPMETALSTDTSSFGSVLGNVADSGADAMYRFFAHINGIPMMSQYAQGQYQFGIEGIHVTGMLPSYYAVTKGAGAYETTSQSGAGGVSSITEKTKPFAQAYRKQFGDAKNPPKGHPMYMGFNTYDAVHIYRNAVERAGTADYENNLDDIVAAMLETDYTGVAGTVEFFGKDEKYPHDVKPTRNSGRMITNYPVTQWQPKQNESARNLECVYPEQHRTADHVAPAWMS